MNDLGHILVVDDEESMAQLVAAYLQREHYQVSVAHHGKEAIEKIKRLPIDLVVLDVMMPVMDGFTTCQAIRQFSRVPMIIVTAKGEEESRVSGLKLGADDYLVKPFSLKELGARIEALLRRSNYAAEPLNICRVGKIVMDIDGRTVRVDNEMIGLTRKEYDLLHVLVRNKEKVFSREKLHELVWGMDETGGTLRTVDTHIKTLRLKLGAAGQYIATVWGVGYKLEEPNDEEYED